jgi:hypothetical protein
MQRGEGLTEGHLCPVQGVQGEGRTRPTARHAACADMLRDAHVLNHPAAYIGDTCVCRVRKEDMKHVR